MPYAFREKLEEYLCKMQEQSIILPGPFSNLAAPVVAVIKADGYLRVCGDYKLAMNQVSQLDKYPLPDINDHFSKLAGGQTYSKLDFSQAYQQVVLDEILQECVTINTHKELFRFHRLSFGVHSAPPFSNG